MEIIGREGAKVSGDIRATGFVFTGNNCAGAQTWQQGYSFAVGAGFALTLSEGHAGTLIIKGNHASGKSVEHINFAVMDDVVMTQTVSQFGSSIVSVTVDGTNINIQSNFNNTHIAYMLTYF